MKIFIVLLILAYAPLGNAIEIMVNNIKTKERKYFGVGDHEQKIIKIEKWDCKTYVTKGENGANHWVECTDGETKVATSVMCDAIRNDSASLSLDTKKNNYGFILDCSK